MRECTKAIAGNNPHGMKGSHFFDSLNKSICKLTGPNGTMAQDKSSNDSNLRQRTTAIDLPREKLPQDLQNLVDNEESLMDQLYDGT